VSAPIHRPFLDLSAHQPRRKFASVAAFNLLVALAYATTGYAGLHLAFVGQTVTLFWPPSGIAFASVWLGGLEMLPGVALGAFAVNMVMLHSPLMAAVIAVGNTLPSIVAMRWLRRVIAAGRAPGELQRVSWFIVVAALGATTFSATLGSLVVSLMAGAGGSIQSIWATWWMGDAMGVLIVAPPILLWRRFFGGGFRLISMAESAAFGLAGLAIIAGLLFIRGPIWAVELCKLFTLVLILGAGACFGLGGPAATTLLMAVGAVGVTVLGEGPFRRGNFNDSFALLHSYLFANALAGLLLAAALADLRNALQSERLARTEAEEASANRARLLTMISHDIRTPLSGIMGVLQTLSLKSLEPEPERLVDLGLRAGNALTKLVSDILDAARADADRIALDPAPFDPACSLSDIVEINRVFAARKGLSVTLSNLDALPPLLLGDRVRFEQLVGNLLGNAVAYTTSGGVTVAARWDADAANPLIVEISDTGPGMDPARVPEMFDTFVLEPRPDDRSTGLGLGLHICRHLVQLMDGSIDYARLSCGGSQFRIALPLGPTIAPPPAAAPSPEPPLRVLLVEDDDIARETTCALLQARGHLVSVAADSETAVALATTRVFDLILMDIQLAQSSQAGVDATRRIRALPSPHGEVAIIALTSDGIEDHHYAYRAAGVDAVVVKPFSLTSGLAHLAPSKLGLQSPSMEA
jgi:signal transduction histidine kinase/CheY-like chemotaxis protein